VCKEAYPAKMLSDDIAWQPVLAGVAVAQIARETDIWIRIITFLVIGHCSLILGGASCLMDPFVDLPSPGDSIPAIARAASR